MSVRENNAKLPVNRTPMMSVFSLNPMPEVGLAGQVIEIKMCVGYLRGIRLFSLYYFICFFFSSKKETIQEEFFLLFIFVLDFDVEFIIFY